MLLHAKRQLMDRIRLLEEERVFYVVDNEDQVGSRVAGAFRTEWEVLKTEYERVGSFRIKTIE